MVETRRTSRRLQAKAAAVASSPTPSTERSIVPTSATACEPHCTSEEMKEEVPGRRSESNQLLDPQGVPIVELEKQQTSWKTETGAADDEDDGDLIVIKQDEEEDEDVEHYALLAASGLNLSSRCPSGSKSEPIAASVKRTVATAALVKRRMVSDQLDSDASQFQEFFSFGGTKRSTAAALRADAQATEEAKIIAASRKAVAHSERQRVESQHKKSAGRRWFNFESEEMTADARRDFALLRMRNYLDPKKFYKSSDHSRALPKHFQMGQVIEGAHEFHSARLTKKQRRQTFTDEIMADEAVVQYTHRVAGNIQAARSNQGRTKKKRRY
uniref:Fcf2 pre-rRNA processing C-terminal domain-containing protein n=1 Tax=Peronospora matthiolae TaxID=2874970 RepID=A0AAV1UDD8_9STRA